MEGKEWHLKLDAELLSRAVNVVVVGCGGTGSHLAVHLATLHQSMMDLGHPEGLAVTIVDPDVISAANVGRQRYFHADIGASKAQVLVNRINLSLGLRFTALSIALDSNASELSEMAEADIVIGCVDTRAARRTIFECMRKTTGGRGSYDHRSRRRIYLDAGNGESDGQVVVGHVGAPAKGQFNVPTVMDLYPEFLDPGLDPVDDGPSCSRAEALTRQGAFVNATAALLAVNMLSTLFKRGELDYSACFFNTESGSVTTLPCDAGAWLRFGYSPRTPPAKVEEPAEVEHA